jgi:hypothetical protein
MHVPRIAPAHLETLKHVSPGVTVDRKKMGRFKVQSVTDVETSGDIVCNGSRFLFPMIHVSKFTILESLWLKISDVRL